ncbi:protein starmaker-like [Physella acuta]|uniref:protein starmaker-like n=1 Tax=Physella acuta TaxID=109671 RepID=UPI0027DAF38D|nr:protein starmaker-like [Physella acuta]
MAIKTKTFSLAGLACTVLCVVAIVVSFASDRWVVSTEKEVSGFKNIGLWSACFSRYRPPAYALVDKFYDGCWWVLDREMDDLRVFLFPGWFVGTQVLVSISLFFELLATIILIVNIINCFLYHPLKLQITRGLSMSAAILHGLTGILLAVAVIMFGARADNSRTWLEKPDQNYLSWSFGICVLAVFLAIIAMMFQFLEFFRYRLEHGQVDEPKVYFTKDPPPATNYAYSHQNNSQSSINTAHSLKSPAYASRYQGSQSSINARPPDTTFAVSGRGEVYINGLANPPPAYHSPRTNPRSSTYSQRRQYDDPDSQRAVDKNGTQKSGAGRGNDYEESKQIKQPVLPEYVKKGDEKKKSFSDSSEGSDVSDGEAEKKKMNVSSVKKKKSSESKKSKSKSRSDSENRKKKKKSDEKDDKRRSSKKHRSKDEDSDEDRSRSRSRRRSSKGSSPHSKRRSSRSRDRSRSRDLNSTYSDSDAGSVRSRSRRRHDKDEAFSRKDGKRRSASEDRSKSKKKHSRRESKKPGHYSEDDISGSEYSSRRKTKSHGSESGRVKKSRSREFSDNESVQSKQSRRTVDKPKGTYSSYYEY